MSYISIGAEVRVDEVLSSLGKGERFDLWVELNEEFEVHPLDDPSTLLEFIVELRKRGYTVEPS